MTVPRNRKQHAPVAGMRHHDGRIAGKKRTVKYQVNALAGRNHRLDRRVRLPADRIGKRPRGVHHHFGRDTHLESAQGVLRHYSVNEPFMVLRQSAHGGVVEERGPLLRRCLRHVDEQPRIVELAVVVHHAAAQPFLVDGRQPT